MKPRSKFSSEHDDGDDEETGWQDSYSDLMTDLLAIFVILFAFAMMSQAIEASKTKSASSNIIDISTESVLAGSDGVMNGEDSVLNGEDSILSEEDSEMSEEESFNSLYEHMKSYIKEAGLSEQLSVSKIGNKQILLRVAASVFFDSGQAEINASSESLLSIISEILVKYDGSTKMIRIEGHTDNRPIKTSQFDSNWELSTTRAVNVLRWLLEESELDPKKLSAVGYSEFYPIANNKTEAGRAKNRRVDFFIEAVDN
ncbi:OmpA family protein [Anaerosporobacter sp.]